MQCLSTFHRLPGCKRNLATLATWVVLFLQIQHFAWIHLNLLPENHIWSARNINFSQLEQSKTALLLSKPLSNLLQFIWTCFLKTTNGLERLSQKHWLWSMVSWIKAKLHCSSQSLSPNQWFWNSLCWHPLDHMCKEMWCIKVDQTISLQRRKQNLAYAIFANYSQWHVLWPSKFSQKQPISHLACTLWWLNFFPNSRAFFLTFMQF